MGLHRGRSKCRRALPLLLWFWALHTYIVLCFGFFLLSVGPELTQLWILVVRTLRDPLDYLPPANAGWESIPARLHRSWWPLKEGQRSIVGSVPHVLLPGCGGQREPGLAAPPPPACMVLPKAAGPLLAETDVTSAAVPLPRFKAGRLIPALPTSSTQLAALSVKCLNTGTHVTSCSLAASL